MSATRILNGLKSGLAKGLGLASFIYVTTRDCTFSQRMSGLDNCFLRFPFGYTCTNSTYWNPDFHIYSQASWDTWENTSGYLIPLVGGIVLLDTAIKVYNYYSNSGEPEEHRGSTSIVTTNINSCIYGSSVAFLSFAAYRELLPVFNIILPIKIDLKFLPEEDPFCFRMFNAEAYDTFNSYTWVLSFSFVLHGNIHHFIKSNWAEFTDWTRYAISEAAKGFRSGCKLGLLFTLLSLSPTRDMLYSKKASEFGHDWFSKFPRFGFDCTPSTEFDDNLHGLSVGEGIKVVLLYSGPGIILLSGSINAGYQFFQAYYTYRGRTIAFEERPPEHFVNRDLENPLLASSRQNRHPILERIKLVYDLNEIAMVTYGFNHLIFSAVREHLTYQNIDNFPAVDSSFRDASNQLTSYFDIIAPVTVGLSIFASGISRCKKRNKVERKDDKEENAQLSCDGLTHQSIRALS